MHTHVTHTICDTHINSSQYIICNTTASRCSIRFSFLYGYNNEPKEASLLPHDAVGECNQGIHAIKTATSFTPTRTVIASFIIGDLHCVREIPKVPELGSVYPDQVAA